MRRAGGHTVMTEPQITYRGMEHSPAMDAKIRELAAKLGEFNPKITSCHVVVGESDRHRHKGNHFEVHVDIHVPGADVVSCIKDNEDPYVALHDAFHVLRRTLDEQLERKRGDTRRTASRAPDEPGDMAQP